ncbi:hypothetical protein BDV12DRAFT_180955 [Aspergillus spectabilis]
MESPDSNFKFSLFNEFSFPTRREVARLSDNPTFHLPPHIAPRTLTPQPSTTKMNPTPECNDPERIRLLKAIFKKGKVPTFGADVWAFLCFGDLDRLRMLSELEKPYAHVVLRGRIHFSTVWKWLIAESEGEMNNNTCNTWKNCANARAAQCRKRDADTCAITRAGEPIEMTEIIASSLHTRLEESLETDF